MDMMDTFVRVLYCMSANEEKISKAVEILGDYTAVIPMKEKSYKSGKVWEVRREKLMPGYVFVYSEHETDAAALKKIDKVIRLLHYGEDSSDNYLRDQDLEFAMMLINKQGLMPRLPAVKQGDFIKINDGVLKEMHGKVISINKNRHMVNVEIDFLGAARNIWIGYDLIESENLE